MPRVTQFTFYTILIVAGFLVLNPLTHRSAHAQLNPPVRVGGPLPQTQPVLPTPTPSTPQLAPTPTPIIEAGPLIANEPLPATKGLYIFNLEQYLQLYPENKSWQYDVINLVSTLQGLVNRQEPQLYILYVHEQLSSNQMNVDEFWLEFLRGPNEFLSDYELIQVKTLEDLLELFRTYFTAIVLWDPELPATGNVALTISGADGMLPVRYDKSPDSLYSQIVKSGPGITAQVQLSGMFTGVGYIPGSNSGAPTTQTAKTDAYMWAKLNYLENGLCSPTYLANYLDPYDWEPRMPGYQYPYLQQCMIVNHDFYISQKAFFLDLDPWFDESATDSNLNPFHRGIDQNLLLNLLDTAFKNTAGDERILRVGGFVPWWIKYSNQYIYGGGRSGDHSPAATTEEFIGHISKYNGIIDADSSPIASIANASVYQHVPLDDTYYQNPIPPKSSLENKNYILFTIGDFRSSAQLYQTIPSLWQDSMRGEIPLAWAISPMLSERVPHIFNYLYKRRTRNDYFISGTPGAGLCHINRFLPADRSEGLGNRLPFWEKLSAEFYKKFDLQISIAADLSREARGPEFSQDLQKTFLSFSPHGVGTVKKFASPLVDEVIPFIQENANILEKLPPMTSIIKRIVQNSREGEPVFHLYRFNLANPTTLFLIYQQLRENYEKYNFQAVDPYTFFYLLRQHYAGNDPSVNYIIPNFLTDTIPQQMDANGYYPSNITLRNDGWDTWNPPEVNPNQGYRLTYRWYYEGEQIPGTGWHDAYVKEAIFPGQQTTLNLNILAPEREGLYRLVLLFGQENVRESFLPKEIRIYVNAK